MTTYEIHPRIGVARLGNSVTDFYLSPARVGGLPIACDEWGNVLAGCGPVREFKDSAGAIKRQAAKFQIYAKDSDGHLEPVSLETADIATLEWSVHIANKKPVWHTFSELQGDLEFGPDNSYKNQHIGVNNPNVTKPADRQALIIDPGPRSISQPNTSVAISRYDIPESYPHGSFPDPSEGGQQIDVLGEIKMDAQGNLVALGGFGKVTGSGDISSFRGASGYWDDVSDGLVYARVTLTNGTQIYTEAAWLIVGSPKYAPEVVNITTLADTMADIAIRKNGANTDIFPGGAAGSDYWPRDPGNNYTPLQGFNPDYIVNFERDVKPIMDRMGLYKYVANIPTMDDYARPNFDVRLASDAMLHRRMRYFNAFRMPLLPEDYAAYYPSMSKGPAQLYQIDEADPQTSTGLPMMPLNSGDNSVTNTGPIYKFDTLSPTQYFYLYQWARGKFSVTSTPDDAAQAQPVGHPSDWIDTGNCVGSPFSPGIEVTWSTRSPEIYDKPMQIKLSNCANSFADMAQYYADNGLSTTRDECAGGGCEPGDLTKRMAIPWMADFHECTVQIPNISNINVNQQSDGSGIEAPPAFYVYWWPPQSPFNVTTGTQNAQDQVLDAFVSDIDGQPIIPAGQNVEFQRGINSAQAMISAWSMLGFLINRGDGDVPYIVETERNFAAFGQMHINEIATAAANAANAAKA